jgi:hypothetical protein
MGLGFAYKRAIKETALHNIDQQFVQPYLKNLRDMKRL